MHRWPSGIFALSGKRLFPPRLDQFSFLLSPCSILSSPTSDEVHDTIARSELDLRQVASYVGPDWPMLAMYLGLNDSDLEEISSRYTSDEECAYAMLLFWQEQTTDLQVSGRWMSPFAIYIFIYLLIYIYIPPLVTPLSDHFGLHHSANVAIMSLLGFSFPPNPVLFILNLSPLYKAHVWLRLCKKSVEMMYFAIAWWILLQSRRKRNGNRPYAHSPQPVITLVFLFCLPA